MLVSLNWIRDYVELPADLDPVALGEQFTRTTAEVDGVHRLEVAARGLIAAAVKSVAPLSGNLRLAVLDVAGKTVETVTAAPKLAAGDQVVYAPPGASVKATGEIGVSTVAGRTSTGMILAAGSLGIELGGQEAVFLSDEFKPGSALPPELFDDWLVEIDNKSLTNRPDLWGHYGISREIAAIVGRTLRAIEKTPLPLVGEGEPSIPIVIADTKACRRFSAVMLERVPTQPSPLWMQLRLGHVGQRPISALVDLTNYIMLDLGQPMHAFDGDKVRQIEVDWASEGEKFKTLDGVERLLTRTDLMVKSKGKSVGLAGVMGGLETEVTGTTNRLLLESANFDGATVRRTASRLGLRTDASARFEKSLDPANTVLAIRRFVDLAGTIFPELKIASRLSDSFPTPPQPVRIGVNPRHAARTIGREVEVSEALDLLTPLGFEVSQAGSNWEVSVPSYRATGDISIEADVIEEMARRIGYDRIVADMPHTTARTFAVNALHELEQRSLKYFTTAHEIHEIHGYLWYDDQWLRQIGFESGPGPELRNPAAAGLHRLRETLIPGMLAACVKNRFHFDSLGLLELGSVFHSRPGADDHEYRHLGLLMARRGKNVEATLNEQLRSAITRWGWETFGQAIRFEETVPAKNRPWEDPNRTASLALGDTMAGRIGMVDIALRRRMDEHLAAWGIAWAELHLSQSAEISRKPESLAGIPPYPLIEMDFTVEVARTIRFATVASKLGMFQHPLLRSIRFVTSYEGGGKDPRRSLTFRCILGSSDRTLSDSDTSAYRESFEAFLMQSGYGLKKA